MTLSALLLSTLSTGVLPVENIDTRKLQGSAGIIIQPPKKKELNGSAGIIILPPKKKRKLKLIRQ